jgi:hypothetical protein
MHVIGLRTGTKNEVMLSMSDTMRETMIVMALTTTSPTSIILRLEDAIKGGSSLSRPVLRPKLNAFFYMCRDQVSHIKKQIVK